MGAQAVRLSNVDIDKALENKDFEVLFQPIFDLGNGALARMETFVRWRHPSLGVLPPGAFISFFESQGRMSELTRYVLSEALDGYSEWRGPYEPGLSINLAMSDLSDESFPTHFAKLLRDRDFPADLVTLECPMPALDADAESAGPHYARLRQTGARLAIEVRGRADEFLRKLDPFPFDEIKTGGAAILRFARTVRGPGLSAISDLLDIANKANAAITAVGVEDQASLAALRGLGFTAAQGNHLAKVGALKEFRPGRVNEVRALLDLPPLNSDDLSALFRTAGPAPKGAETEAEESAPMVEAVVVHRPSARRPKQDETAAAETADSDASDAEEQKRLKAREKARALALAKRAKAREIRKAAAIKRAKAKAQLAAEQQQADADQAATVEDDGDDSLFPSAPGSEAQALQDRLAMEFAGDKAEHKPQALEASALPEEAATAELAAQEELTIDDAPGVEAPADETSQPTGDAAIQTDETPEPAAEEPLAAAFEEAAPADETPDQPIQRARDARPAAEEQPRAFGMKIGNTGARFRPGLRVGGTPGFSPAAPEPTSQAEPDTTMFPQAIGEADLVFEEIAEQASQDGPKAEAPIQEPPRDDDGEIVYGHLDQENIPDVMPTPRPRKRRKNFLTRRYKVVPTHFWPKSWKRRYRDWKRGKIAAQEA